MRNKSRYTKILTTAVCGLLVSTSALSLDKAKLLEQIRGNSSQYDEFKALLNSPEQSTRISAFDVMVNSGDPSLRDIAIDVALASLDSTLQSIAFRDVILSRETINFKIEGLDKLPEKSKAVLLTWGNNYNIRIHKTDKQSGKIIKGEATNASNLTAPISGTRFSWNSMADTRGCYGETSLENGNELSGTLSCSYPQLAPVKIRATLR